MIHLNEATRNNLPNLSQLISVGYEELSDASRICQWAESLLLVHLGGTSVNAYGGLISPQIGQHAGSLLSFSHHDMMCITANQLRRIVETQWRDALDTKQPLSIRCKRVGHKHLCHHALVHLGLHSPVGFFW